MDPRFAFELGSTLCFQISVVIAVTFLLQRWVGNVRWECRLWTGCFLCLIGLVAAAFLLPHRRLFAFPINLSREMTLHLVVWQSRFAIALACIWLGGIAVSLLKRVILCASLLSFLKHQCEVVDADALLRRVGIPVPNQTKLMVKTSSVIQGPFCWQLHRPTIVLPTFLVDEDDATLRHVMLHELEHLRTQHPMQHFLQGVCSTVFWFHPLVRSAAQGAELTREFLCDEVAAKTVGKFGAYLRTLAKVAERCGNASCTEVPRGTLPFGNQPSVLIRRSNRLVKLAEGEIQSATWRPAVAIAGLLLCSLLVQQVWLPTNVMASQRSRWSPWPQWTANALHQMNVTVRDFETFEDRVQMHELLYDDE